MVIDDVYTYIGEQTSLTAGTDLFKSRQTEEPENQTVVYNTGGFEPDRYLPTEEPTFQVLVRNKSYQTGATLAQTIFELLNRVANQQLVDGGIYFYYIFGMQSPAHIGRDERGRHEFSINFVCKIRQ